MIRIALVEDDPACREQAIQALPRAKSWSCAGPGPRSSPRRNERLTPTVLRNGHKSCSKLK